MAAYTLTVRSGPRVDRERFELLDHALEALRERTRAIQGEGDLPEVSAFRTYSPEQRVKARIELSEGGRLRGRDAGVDVMGDGRLVPFRGGIFRRELELPEGAGPLEAVAAELER